MDFITPTRQQIKESLRIIRSIPLKEIKRFNGELISLATYLAELSGLEINIPVEEYVKTKEIIPKNPRKPKVSKYEKWFRRRINKQVKLSIRKQRLESMRCA